MSKNIKNSFVYEGFGFPIKLINVPIRVVFGEEVLDINLGQLQRDILFALIYKKAPLTGAEVRFTRKFFEMTTTSFGKAFGVTHAAILKWESGQSRIPPTTELCIRLFALDKLKAKNEEFGKLYHRISIEALSQLHNEQSNLLEFNASRKTVVA